MKSSIILIGADKGGVGKTTLSRALLDYLERKNVAARAFDTEHPRGTLKRFYPEITEIVDFTEVADQMKVLDTLDSANARVTLVDLRAGNLLVTIKGESQVREVRKVWAVGQEMGVRFVGTGKPIPAKLDKFE